MQALCAVQLFIVKLQSTLYEYVQYSLGHSVCMEGTGNLDYLEIQIVLYVTYSILWYR
jgi:hypothetical protein